jgi:hypothetical protein
MPPEDRPIVPDARLRSVQRVVFICVRPLRLGLVNPVMV